MKTDEEILKQAMAGGPPKVHVAKLPPLQKRYTKEQVTAAIDRYRGCTTYICSSLDCSFGQFMKAVEKWGLQQQLQDARSQLVDEAETVVLKAMQSDDPKLALDAAKFLLTKMKRASREWATGNGNVNVEVKSDGDVTLNTIFGLPETSNDLPVKKEEHEE